MVTQRCVLLSLLILKYLGRVARSVWYRARGSKLSFPEVSTVGDLTREVEFCEAASDMIYRDTEALTGKSTGLIDCL